MSAVGDQLRQAREAKQLTVEQVAEITKVRSDHVRALEEGNFDVFSAPVYIRGFVRTYAKLLKLDVAGVIKALDGELGQTTRFAEPPPLSNEPRGIVDFLTLQLSKVDWRIGVRVLAVFLIVAIGLLVFLSWRHYRTADPLRNLEPGIYKSPKESGEILPIPAPPKK